METVNRLLGYTYFINGKIIHGRRIGRTIGFPTTNVIPDQGKLLPPNGVYAVRSQIDGRFYNGITNIGTKPTVEGKFVGVETFLYDCEEDFYGEVQKVELLHFLRPEQKFPTLADLKVQIGKDRVEGENYFKINH
jgi:riboflavin kinase/FMN adenylyltransferase